MSYLKKVGWHIAPNTLPSVNKNCPKCGHHARFVNTEKFRVNANKNRLDVWLIYQCNHCKSTWNMTIYERVSPKEIPREEYQLFLENDLELAKTYGFNKGIHLKNKAALDYESITYTVDGEDICHGEGLYGQYDGIEIKLTCSHFFDLRVDKLLSHKMGLTRSQVKSLFKQGFITGSGKENLLKDKVRDGMSIIIKGGL